jgi:hypothetical protein
MNTSNFILISDEMYNIFVELMARKRQNELVQQMLELDETDEEVCVEECDK